MLTGAVAVACSSHGDVTAIGAGSGHTCAAERGGGVECWGYNAYAQLGDGTKTSRRASVAVAGLRNDVTALAAGDFHTCALVSTGAVECWGYNGLGQLGDGTTTDRSRPVAVSGLSSGVKAVTAGSNHSCALTRAGAVECWGYNGYGQLGDGTNSNRSDPVVVSGLRRGVTGIEAGEDHTCAVTGAGGVECWGDNLFGQLGDGTTTERHAPANVRGLATGVVAVAAGEFHTCALRRTGAVECWGRNDSGQLGDGTTIERHSPVPVPALASGVKALALGDVHSCALTNAGAAECWGLNDSGELGDGTTTDRRTPVQVAGLADRVVALAGGGVHTCALTGRHAVECWGNNISGQLGDGTTTARRRPVK